MSKKKMLPQERALSDLEKLVSRAGLRLKVEEQSRECEKPPEKVDPAALPETDEELFGRAMEDVTRTPWKHARTSSDLQLPAPPTSRDAAREEQRLMEAAMAGDPELTSPDHPEYIEGWIGVAGKRFLPRLRDGLYSIQDQIDLHGLSSEEAKQVVEEFVVRMSRFRSCCVKIIHGRGMNSPNDRAVLKENLQRWLSTRRMARHVVAYASAPLKDGGVGAVYVLLQHS
jgi:DNA-nicking Smr family endonuclease